jgi:hypothetical protein
MSTEEIELFKTGNFWVARDRDNHTLSGSGFSKEEALGAFLLEIMKWPCYAGDTVIVEHEGEPFGPAPLILGFTEAGEMTLISSLPRSARVRV